MVVLGLKSYFKNNLSQSLDIIFATTDPEEFLTLYESEEPDYLIIDIISDRTFGLELFEQVFINNTNAKILVYSNVKSKRIIKNLIGMGVNAFIPKQEPLSNFEDAFYSIIHNNKPYLPSNIKKLLGAYKIEKPIIITEMEKKIIPFLLEGNSSKTIAKEFFVTTSAIDFHKKNLFSKFQVNNIASFVKEAISQGYSRGINL